MRAVAERTEPARSHTPWSFLVVGVLAVLALLAQRFGVEALQSVYFISGWLVALLIVVLAVSWWRAAGLDGVRKRVRTHGAMSVLLTTLFLIHVDFRTPNGWLDLALTALFVLSLASLLVGSILLRRLDGGEEQRREERSLNRWVLAHVALTYGLAAVAVFHGVYVHGHGLLAHFFTDR